MPIFAMKNQHAQGGSICPGLPGSVSSGLPGSISPEFTPTNRNISDAELITTVLVSAIYFSGHHEKAMSFMSSTKMITHMLSKSRFNRRLHQIRDLIIDLFFQLSSLIKELNISSEYSIDSFPVSTCDNIRIKRTRLVQGEIYRGKKVSMRRYFYGYNIHLLCTSDGIPVEYTFLPGSRHDSNALKQMPLQLPPGSRIYADSAYTNYSIEDMLKDAENIDLLVAGKSNSKENPCCQRVWIPFESGVIHF